MVQILLKIFNKFKENNRLIYALIIYSINFSINEESDRNMVTIDFICWFNYIEKFRINMNKKKLLVKSKSFYQKNN